MREPELGTDIGSVVAPSRDLLHDSPMSDDSEVLSAIAIERRDSPRHRTLQEALISINGTARNFKMRTIDPNTQDFSPHDQEHAAAVADRATEGLLAFMANLLGAFTTVDPRVITRQERRNGRTALGF